MPPDDEGEARARLALAGEIAAEIAHELRNLLQIISSSSYVARLELTKGDPEAALVHVAKVERNARVAHGVVDDLMALARGEPLGKDDVLVRDVVNASRADLPADMAQWNDAIEPGDLHVRAHAPLLCRLLHAVYENAIHACAPRGPVVATTARRDGNRVVVEVADDGPGIPVALAPHIFDPLVTGRRGGTGLGLALARRIAIAHGGSIALVPSVDISSAHDGSGNAGARFRIELPSDG